jgi:hypothetical protein
MIWPPCVQIWEFSARGGGRCSTGKCRRMRRAPAGGSRQGVGARVDPVVLWVDWPCGPLAATVTWNACDPNKSQAMKMICRSLTVLRMELQNNRVATADGGMHASAHDHCPRPSGAFKLHPTTGAPRNYAQRWSAARKRTSGPSMF